MHRVLLDATARASDLMPPDMTVIDAADAMERSHRSQLLIGSGNEPVGLVSEMDIVSKVLAMGLDPSLVPVSQVMATGRLDAHGSFLIEDELELRSPLWGAEGLSSREDEEGRLLTQILQGKCEECGVLSTELHDDEGMLICEDCDGLRRTLFP